MKEKEDYKMKKVGMLAGVLLVCGLLVTGPAMAVPVNVPVSTLQDLINLNATGGYLIQDKIFSDFNYNGADSASNITVEVVSTFGSTDIHGFSFQDILNGGKWLTGFTLSYVITVAPGNPLVSIIGSKDQINTGSVPNGIVMVDTQVSGTPGTPGVITTRGIGGQETLQVNYAGSPLQSITTASVVSIPDGDGLLSYEQEWFETTATTQVPEPSILLLLGLGLVGVAGFRRKFKK